MTNRSVKDAIFIGLLAIMGAAFALAVGQFALVRISEAKLRDYAGELLRHAVGVAAVSIETFERAERSPAPMCSDADLNGLRYLLFHREDLHDIGRVRDGRLVCTAGWGVFDTPLALPPPHRRQPNGNLLWARVPSPMDSRLVVDIAGHGSVVVFTSPTAFKFYERFDPDFSALVLTRDSRHVFRAFGDTAGLPERFRRGAPAYEIGPRLTDSECAAEVSICVVAALSGVSLLEQPVSTWLAIACLGLLAAGGFATMMVHRRRTLSSLPWQIRRAIADDRLDMVYQPLVRLKDGRMIGVEALVRPTDEQGEVIPPEVFIGIAEDAELVGAITRCVIRRALHDLRDRLSGPDDFHVSINISACDAIDPFVREYLNDATARLGIPRRRIVLELTERSTTDGDRLVDGVAAFRRDGYGFFIDDLGTGYSSLAHLSRLPITGIKVDRMFTQAIGKEAVSSTIVEKICAIADALGVEVVVEGIETREQAAYILEIHPDAAGQGWLYGRPVRVDAL